MLRRRDLVVQAREVEREGGAATMRSTVDGGIPNGQRTSCRMAPVRAACWSSCTGRHQKKLPMVNSKSQWFSYGSGISGKPHSNRSGPSGENHRMPKPVEVRR